MVAHGTSKRIEGCGIIDTLMSPFTVRKYGQEMHSRSLDPKHFLQGYNYVGPRTEVLLREKLGDNIPLNDLDQTAKEHDYAYLHEKQAYDKDHDKQKHINNIWKSDDVFVQRAKNSRDDPIVGNIASKLISTKENLEKSGLMNTKTFSGFGVNEEEEDAKDPVAKLRQLVEEQYKTEGKSKKKIIKGGVLPAALIPIGIAIASTVGSKFAGDIYDWIKKRIVGSGVKVPYHRTRKDKVEFVKNVVNSIE